MAFLDREFIACLKCTQDCFNWHAGHVARPDIAPSFVSRLHRRDGLRIPRQFSGSFLGKCTRQVTLEGPDGREWHAELKRDRDMMILSDPGWSDFVKYHGLQRGDDLLITFLGRGIFKIRIFDTEGYEKGVHCQLSIPTVDACASQVYHNNKKPPPLQNPSNHMIGLHSHDDHPHQASMQNQSQNLSNVLPEKSSVDNSHHQYDEVMGFDAFEEENFTIANSYQCPLIEENISQHEDHDQHKPSLECNFNLKGLDGKHLTALDSFKASHNHRSGVSNELEICDEPGVCNKETLEVDYNHYSTLDKLNVNDACETSIKSVTSCGGQAFNEADCVDKALP